MAIADCELKFKISADHEDFVISVMMDSTLIYQGNPGNAWKEISCTFADSDDQSHTLSIQLSGKTDAHTQINQHGEIIKDHLVHIKEISLDDINVDRLVSALARYTHDHNSNGPTTTDNFYGSMGCNGSVTLDFSTPVYLWLLENM